MEKTNSKLQSESESRFYVIVAESCGVLKYVSRSFPKGFQYSLKLSNTQRFYNEESAQKFIDSFNDYGKYPIKNAQIREVSRVFKLI